MNDQDRAEEFCKRLQMEIKGQMPGPWKKKPRVDSRSSRQRSEQRARELEREREYGTWGPAEAQGPRMNPITMRELQIQRQQHHDRARDYERQVQRNYQ